MLLLLETTSPKRFLGWFCAVRLLSQQREAWLDQHVLTDAMIRAALLSVREACQCILGLALT